MEVISINGYRWQKTIGDEGQDVLVAEFMVEEDKVLGEFPSEKLYDLVIDKDTDLYLPAVGIYGDTGLTEDRIAFKFRKGTFTQEEQDGCLEGLWHAAKPSDNRGLAAGPRSEKHANRDWVQDWEEQVLRWFEKGQPASIDGTDPIENIKKKYGDYSPIRGNAWIRMTIEKEYDYGNFFDIMVGELLQMSVEDAKKAVEQIRVDYISDATYASQVWSGIAGFYDRYPRIPFGRPTRYTEQVPEKFAKCYPFARKLDNEFARLLPKRYGYQKNLADNTDKKFLIGEDTTFTTVTVNTTTKDRNARMACHRDAGSLNEGFSNLAVIGDGKKSWKGGYLVCPEVRVAINVRPGDLLLVDNMRIIHGNTPIEAPDTGEDDLLRMSLIFYYRENMKELGSWEYEATRRQYVKDREKNQEHPLWWSRWNGVSPDMWTEQEWYDYLEMKLGREAVVEYHPEAFQESGSLEDFF
jgi:hypothetical protein